MVWWDAALSDPLKVYGAYIFERKIIFLMEILCSSEIFKHVVWPRVVCFSSWFKVFVGKLSVKKKKKSLREMCILKLCCEIDLFWNKSIYIEYIS